jgi:hypothetical protein
MATDQFDNYQLDPNTIGDDWVFADDHIHMNRPPNSKIPNYQYYFVGPRMSIDRTRTLLGGPDPNINPQKEVNDAWLGHGVDWSLFNYNPYGRQDVWNSTWSQNPNFRVMNDWLLITGLGGIDVVTDDVMDKDEIEPSGMVQYMNYPTEGYSSFGKKYDKRWIWQGNTWVPGGSYF